MENNYEILIKKLDEFIRKYYKNLLIRGAIYCLAALLLFYIIVVILEYAGSFNSLLRTVIFYTYITVNLVLIFRFIIIPLGRLFRIGKLISHEQAAIIIGKHFGDVKDTLINTLQLKSAYETNPINASLIKASIDQKIEKLKPIPFTTAVDIKQNKKYLKFAFIPFLVILIILFSSPSFITGPTERLINHDKYYKKEAPFTFEIQNKNLNAVQQEDFELKVKVSGNEVPESIYIEIDGNQYQMEKDNTISYHYTFKNPQKNIVFQLVADNVLSDEYQLKVLPKPTILNFLVNLDYPAYINKNDETIQNTGDIVVPEGTKVNWKFETQDTREIRMKFKDKLTTLHENKGGFSYSATIIDNQSYTIVALNQHFTNKDSLLYSISVVPDEYPVIKATEYSDSLYDNKRYYKGIIKDDYGFKLLTFNYRKINSNQSNNINNSFIRTPVSISNSLTQQEFYYYFDFSVLENQPGDEYEYFFEVWDNDGINGSKSSRSTKMTYRTATLEELKKAIDESSSQIKSDLTQSIIDVKKLQKEVEEMTKKLVDKKTLTWQDKQKIKDLIDKQISLQEKMKKIEKTNFEKSIKEQQYQAENETLLKKQEELQKLFEQLPEDIKDLLRQIQEMLEKFDKEKVGEMLDKMKLSNKDIEKELDRNMQLFKQLEFEQKLNQTIDELNKLAEKQEELSKETESAKQEDNQGLKEKQDSLNKEFEKIKEAIKDVEKKNNNLEEPNNLPETQQEQKEIETEMNNSSGNLSNNKNKKASQSQKNASDKMMKLSKMLEDAQMAMEEEELGEDINTLREILENLVQASFKQEDLISQLKATQTTDPKYIKIIQEQKQLKDDIQIIEDSLYALSKRQTQIESFINKEIADVKENVSKAIENLNKRNTGTSAVKQQLAMTSINNLALFLSETLNNMQQQQAQQKAGGKKKSGSCSKPGSGSPSSKTMKQLQEQLNKQMKELREGMKTGKLGQKSISESLAKLAAQQEAIRKQLQDIIGELKKEGNTNTGQLNKLMDKMEQTETELVNKILSDETLKRQEEILTRLLESEKAEKEREKDEKRESIESKDEKNRNPSDFFKYNSIKIKEVELIKTISPSLKPFYKNKVNEYFYNFEE